MSTIIEFINTHRYICTTAMAKKLHPKCGPCALCNKTKFQYSHPCEWNQTQQHFIRATCCGITMTSCICKACVLDVKRNSTNPVYRPRWKKSKPSCQVCKNVLNVKACKIADTATITRVLQLAAGQQQSEDIRLCTDHYNAVYHSLPQKLSLLDHQNMFEVVDQGFQLPPLP